MFDGFSKDSLKFLRQLQKNNNRDWFNSQKPRYEKVLLFPALELVETIAGPLEKVSPCFQAVAKRSGGSVMRIYRDVRFSKDKTPYKTNLGLHFRHRQGKDVHAPGFYFHVSPAEIFFAAGIWSPANPALNKIRSLIDEDPDRWKKIFRAKTIKADFSQMGSTLKRPPRGYPADHPLINDLKMKDHVLAIQMSESDLLDAALIKQLIKNMKTTMHYMRFLCEALQLPC